MTQSPAFDPLVSVIEYHLKGLTPQESIALNEALQRIQDFDECREYCQSQPWYHKVKQYFEASDDDEELSPDEREREIRDIRRFFDDFRNAVNGIVSLKIEEAKMWLS